MLSTARSWMISRSLSHNGLSMSFILQPWQLFLMVLASWVHREQQKIIEFYQAELKAVMDAQGKKRLLLTDETRRLLAVKGKSLGRKALMELTTIVTPDTILRWHRTLVAQQWDYSDRKNKQPGRPRIRQVIVNLVLRFAKENPTWGYDRIQGAVANIGYHISDTTVGNVLKQHGIEPAPDRKRQTTWKTFIKSHWDVLAAIDFTTIEVWTKGGLVTYYLLFVMELATRRVHLAACTPSLGDDFMKQIARNLTDPFDGFLKDKKYVLMDRDANFSQAFRAILKQADVEPVQLPARSPDLNSHIERFHLSIKSECLSRMIFFGEQTLRRAMKSYLTHCHEERNHQSLDNAIISPDGEVGSTTGEVQCRERLGGMLNYYFRRAA
jgi:putative transposase